MLHSVRCDEDKVMEILSMTGYGSAKGTVEGLNISAELKSVNNRYLDVSVRLPRGFLFAEEAVKAAVQQHISRGKVDVFLTVDSSQAADTVVRVNEPLLRAYLDHEQRETSAELERLREENRVYRQNAEAAKRSPVQGAAHPGGDDPEADPFLTGFNGAGW